MAPGTINLEALGATASGDLPKNSIHIYLPSPWHGKKFTVEVTPHHPVQDGDASEFHVQTRGFRGWPGVRPPTHDHQQLGDPLNAAARIVTDGSDSEVHLLMRIRPGLLDHVAYPDMTMPNVDVIDPTIESDGVKRLARGGGGWNEPPNVLSSLDTNVRVEGWQKPSSPNGVEGVRRPSLTVPETTVRSRTASPDGFGRIGSRSQSPDGFGRIGRTFYVTNPSERMSLASTDS
jgi:hypothetical protein